MDALGLGTRVMDMDAQPSVVSGHTECYCYC